MGTDHEILDFQVVALSHKVGSLDFSPEGDYSNPDETASIGLWRMDLSTLTGDSLQPGAWQVRRSNDGYMIAYDVLDTVGTEFLMIEDPDEGTVTMSSTFDLVDNYYGDLAMQSHRVFNKDFDLFDRNVGLKNYEITDHLSNVRAVISDVKQPVDSGTNFTIDYYVADVTNATDYYPFGMMMPGRNFPSGDYRFAFNGMEKDDEIAGSGNSYTTYFRQYDARIGRWLSIDPKFNYFPWQSPYVAFDNNPIFKNDPKGDAAQEQNDPNRSRVEKKFDRKFERWKNRIGMPLIGIIGDQKKSTTILRTLGIF